MRFFLKRTSLKLRAKKKEERTSKNENTRLRRVFFAENFTKFCRNCGESQIIAGTQCIKLFPENYAFFHEIWSNFCEKR